MHFAYWHVISVCLWVLCQCPVLYCNWRCYDTGEAIIIGYCGGVLLWSSRVMQIHVILCSDLFSNKLCGPDKSIYTLDHCNVNVVITGLIHCTVLLRMCIQSQQIILGRWTEISVCWMATDQYRNSRLHLINLSDKYPITSALFNIYTPTFVFPRYLLCFLKV